MNVQLNDEQWWNLEDILSTRSRFQSGRISATTSGSPPSFFEEAAFRGHLMVTPRTNLRRVVNAGIV